MRAHADGEGEASAARARRPTIRDVARRAGVSVSTVSLVINERGPVSERTRAVVLDAIAALDFQPNSSAQRLKRTRASSIGLVVPDLRNEFFALVTEGVQEVTQENDVLLVLCSTDARAEREAYFTYLLRTRRLDGVIYLSGTGVEPRSLADLASIEPVTFVDERLPGLDVPFVGSDNRGGARALARHVLELGHERVSIVAGPPGLWTSEQRLAGYREALAAGGRDPDEAPVARGDYRERSGYQAAGRLLAGPTRKRPTVLLCANDLMAIGALRYCREHSLRVPHDVSVTGFDDIPFADLLTPSLSTVRQPAWEMGHAAAKLLLGQVMGRTRAIEPKLLSTELVIRDSTAPPC